MPGKKQTDDLSRDGEPKQRTKEGITIPVPGRQDFFSGLEKAAKTPKKPEESESGTPRTSRDQ